MKKIITPWSTVNRMVPVICTLHIYDVYMYSHTIYLLQLNFRLLELHQLRLVLRSFHFQRLQFLLQVLDLRSQTLDLLLLLNIFDLRVVRFGHRRYVRGRSLREMTPKFKTLDQVNAK